MTLSLAPLPLLHLPLRGVWFDKFNAEMIAIAITVFAALPLFQPTRANERQLGGADND
jgi:hypothetical protein